MFLSTKRILPAALAGTIALSGTLAATQPAGAAAYVVPGAPGVANVSVIQGDVVIQRGDGGGQFGASINTPLLPGDYISTAGESRSEVQFNGISMLREAQNTQVRFVNLDPRTREMQLPVGTTELAELRGADGGPQLDTPSLTVRPNRTGAYRVSVLNNGETLVTVRSGAATISTGSGSQILRPGSTLIATGAYDNPAISFASPIAYDAFDAFNQNRNATILASYNANNYLSPDLAGYANFAYYGQWYNVPSYGEVWAPSNQANDWSPYSNGQWVWEPGYGYTWVGNEPWGYVPYHYGNWFYSTAYNQWMWQPPAYQYQTNADVLASSWLPALVGFFLTGGNGFGYNPYGYGGIGWVPLAPGEQYNPWYPGFGIGANYPAYAVNNVTNIINIYRNIRFVKIVRIYDFDRFRDGDWHHPIIMHPDSLKRVAVLHGSLPIVPTKALLRSSTVAAAHPIVLSSRFEQQRFASRTPALTSMTVARAQRDLQTVVSKPQVHGTSVTAPVRNEVPEHTAVPMHTMTPMRTMTPTHTIAPERPVHTFAPTRTAAPVPVHTAVPPHQVSPIPVRTMAPRPMQTMVPRPMHTMAPERTITPERAMPSVRPARTMAPAAPRSAAPYRPASSAAPMPHATQVQRPQPHQPQATETKKPEPEKTQKPA